MKTRIAFCAALLPALLLLGCGSVPTTEIYDVHCSTQDLQQKADEPTDESITVRPFSAPESYDRREIIYRKTPHRLHYDNYRRWAARPAAITRNEFIRCLRATDMFQQVLRDGSGGDYQLFGRLLQFDELERDDGRWAAVSLEVTLTNSQEDPLFTRTLSAEVKAAESEDLTGLAEAMGSALREVVSEFVEEGQKHLDAPSAGDK